MQLTTTTEQDELRRSVRRFLEARSPELEVRRLMENTTGYDPGVWRDLAELGILGLLVPSELGGSGATFADAAVVAEEMGRALLCAPWLSTAVLAVSALVASADDDAQRRWLPRIAAGEAIATLALAEASCRWDESGIATAASSTASSTDRDVVVTGEKLFVLDGHIADLILVVARREGVVHLVAVEGDAPGVTRSLQTTMDQTRKLAAIRLDNASGILVGAGGWGPVAAALDAVVAMLAAEQVGGAERTLELAVAYAKERHQFGRPIGSFQAVKHRCADMLVRLEGARSSAAYAAWCATSSPDELPLAAAMAKTFCSAAYMQNATDNIQVHGGIGFTWEHCAHLYFKRAKSSELLFGGPEIHQDRVADLVGLSAGTQ